MAGNAVLIKPSPYTPLTTHHFEEAFKSVGLENLVNDFFMEVTEINEIYNRPEIGYVHFTGSTTSGHHVLEEVA